MTWHPGEDLDQASTVTFPVVAVADAMGWESRIVRSELSDLQFNDRQTSGSSSAKSSVLVEFNTPSFHVVSPGDLTSEELDFVCDFLLQRTKQQERSEIDKLHLLYASLRSVATGVGNTAGLAGHGGERVECQTKLTGLITSYFADELDHDTMAELGIDDIIPTANLLPKQREDIARSVRALVSANAEHRFTGRAVARIFQGNGSPCFPAVTWGRQKRFWRRYLHVDFGELCRIATAMLLELR